MIKKAINKETGAEYNVLISMTTFSPKQFAMIQAIIAHYDAAVAADAEGKISTEERERYAKRQYRRVEIFRAATAVEPTRACSPYYVTKNKALQTAAHLYDLKRAKLAKSADSEKTAKPPKSEKKAKIEAGDAPAALPPAETALALIES